MGMKGGRDLLFGDEKRKVTDHPRSQSNPQECSRCKSTAVQNPQCEEVSQSRSKYAVVEEDEE